MNCERYLELGCPLKIDGDLLTNKTFPSKIGGKPAWLELNVLPPREKLRCSKCQKQMSFLCQIYAPRWEDENAYRRTIYVFLCRSAACQVPNVADNFVVLRSQLPNKNDYYSESSSSDEDYDDDDDDDDEEEEAHDLNRDKKYLLTAPTKQKLCIACGCLGPMRCDRCRNAYYCCADHQRAHWPQHKRYCFQSQEQNIAKEKTSEMIESDPLPEIEFEEFEILMGPGDDDESYAVDGKNSIYQKAFMKLSDDKQFQEFNKEIAVEPHQVVRVEPNGSPLWITDVKKSFGISSSEIAIPKCEACGSIRQFEIQIMPQILPLLGDSGLRWGVLVIYTCAKSCNPAADVGYLQEFMIKQDIDV